MERFKLKHEIFFRNKAGYVSNGRLHNYGIGILPMKTVNISLGFIGSLGCCSSKVGRFTQKISKDLAPKSRPSIFFFIQLFS